MWTYFRGWKRKIGVATLVMALALMGAWMRSHFSFDQLMIDGRTSTVGAFSFNRSLLIYLAEAPKFFDSPPSSPHRFWYWETGDLRHVMNPFDPFKYVNGSDVLIDGDHRWKLDIGDLHVDLVRSDMEGATCGCYTFLFHYSYVVLPLILISAWCLLTKPRTKPATKPDSSNA
jgi:hypothetical protein